MAELTKNQLSAENSNSFPNNNSGQITPTVLRAFNNDMIDSLVDEISYTADSASFNSRINNVTGSAGTISGSAQITALGFVSSSVTASSLVTASFDNGTRNLTFTKGDASTFNVNIPDVSGSTGNFATTGSNTFTGLNTFNAGVLIPSASTQVFYGNDNSLGFFDAYVIGGQPGRLNIRRSGVGANSGSAVHIQNSNLIVSGGFSVSSSTQPISFSGSSFIVDTFDGGGAITFRPGTATNFFGNTNFTSPIRTTIVNVDNLAAGGYYGFNAEVDGRIYQDFSSSVNSRILAITGSGGGTISVQDEGSILGNATSFNFNGAGVTATLSAGTASITIPGGGGSIDTGSFATTGSNTFTGNQTISTAGNTQLNLIAQPGFQTNIDFQSQNSNFQAYGDFRINNFGQFGGSGSIKFTTSNNFMELAADSGTKIGATNGGGNGIDAGAISMQVRSGTLSLAPAGFSNTTASLSHLSASSNVNFVNLVFKSNNNTGDTIISGSNNIFVNPPNPTAGFKRYVGGFGNYLGIVPQITGSYGFSPTMGNNIISTGMLMRIPVSSSAYTITGNIFNNPAFNGLQLGTAAGTNFERAVSGLTMNNNVVNGTIGAVASKTPLSSSITISSNNIGGTAVLNMDSSSINLQGNVIQGSLTINNSYFPSTFNAASANFGFNGGLNIGSNNTIFASGSNTTFTSGRTITHAVMMGASNVISASLNGDLAQVHSTALIGQSLNVIGSNSRTITANAADWGSVFAGRWNSLDGTKNFTAETVFAVGTGTGAATRKTGFLIDSGSNTFIEGTLNVSGSTTMTGSVLVNGVVTQNVTAPANNTQSDFVSVTGATINGVPYNYVNQGLVNYPSFGAAYSDAFVTEYYDSLSYNYGAEFIVNGGRVGATLTASGSGAPASFRIQDQYNGTTFGNFYADDMQIGEFAAGTNTRIGIGHTTLPILELKAVDIDVTGSVSISPNSQVKFATGSNQQAGTATMVAGEAIVSNSLVSANSIILLTKQTFTSNHFVAVSSKGAGTFTIESSNNSDTDTVGYFIINNS